MSAFTQDASNRNTNPRMLNLSLPEIAAAPIAELLRGLQTESQVRLHVHKPAWLDALRAAQFAIALSRPDIEIELDVESGSKGEKAFDSFSHSGLAALFANAAPGAKIHMRGTELRASAEATIDAARRLLVVQPSTLAAYRRIPFQQALLSLFTDAGIEPHKTVKHALATICFEATTNAEEHGVTDEEGAPKDQLRYLFARINDGHGERLAPEAAEYLSSFHSQQPRSRGWLELVVADSGLGICYPSYYLSARDTNRSNCNVYQADIAEEHVRLARILNTNAESTKGRWGRVFNRETEKGDGTKFIKFRLSAFSGYAAIRTGRSMAEWYFAKPERTPQDVEDFGPYSVHDREYPLLKGSIWYFLAPLTPQLALPL